MGADGVARAAVVKHTTEIIGDSRRILVHIPGGRPLSKQFPANKPVRWSIAICTLDRGFAMLEGDVSALYDEASKLGRPLERKEAMAFLLGRRLTG